MSRWTVQGHSSRQLQMVTDVTEGFVDSTRVSVIYLCIYVFMQGQGAYPWLDIDTEHATAVGLCDS